MPSLRRADTSEEAHGATEEVLFKGLSGRGESGKHRGLGGTIEREAKSSDESRAGCHFEDMPGL